MLDMKYLLLLIGIFGVLTVGYSQEFSFLITFDISQEDVISNVTVEFLDTDPFLPGNGVGEYSINLIDSLGTTVYETPIWITFARIGILPPPENKSGFEELEMISFWARVPYYKDAQLLQFWHSDSKLLEINLEEELCVSDGLCSVFCKGKGIDLDCPVDVREEPLNESGFPIWIYLIASLVVVILGLVFFLSVKKA